MPVLEAWTTLTAAAMVTERVTVGTFVRERHEPPPGGARPDGRDAPEASGGRLVLGHRDRRRIRRSTRRTASRSPPPPERALHLREAVAVLRALWTGGPVTRDAPFYPLRDAYAYPIPDPPPPILIGAGTPAGARLAAEIGDGWGGSSPTRSCDLEPRYREALARPVASDPTAGRARVRRRRRKDADPLSGDPLVVAPRDELARWLEAGADGVILTARTTADVDALVARGRSLVGGLADRAGRPAAPFVARWTRDDRPRPRARPRTRPPTRPTRAPAAARPSPSTSACASAATRSG